MSRISLRRFQRLAQRVRQAEAEADAGTRAGAGGVARRCLDSARLRADAAVLLVHAGLSCLLKGRDEVASVERRRGRVKLLRAVQTQTRAPEASAETETGPRTGAASSSDGDPGSLARHDSDAAHGYPDLFLAGSVVHVRRRVHGAGSARFEALCVDSLLDPALGEVVLSEDTLVDHMPWRLAAALAECNGFRFSRRVARASPAPPPPPPPPPSDIVVGT